MSAQILTWSCLACHILVKHSTIAKTNNIKKRIPNKSNEFLTQSALLRGNESNRTTVAIDRQLKK